MELLFNNDQNIQYGLETDTIDYSCESTDCISFDEGYYGSYNDQIYMDTSFSVNHKESAFEENHNKIKNNQRELCQYSYKSPENQEILHSNSNYQNNFSEEQGEAFPSDFLKKTLDISFLTDFWYHEQNIKNNLEPISKNHQHIVEDSIDIQAYLYEIEMNLEYFKNDLVDFQDNNLDHNLEKMLSFNSAINACNMVLYEKEVTRTLQNYSNNATFCDDSSFVDDFTPSMPFCFNEYLDSELVSVQNECGETTYYSENLLGVDVVDVIEINKSDYKLSASEDSQNGINLAYDVFENVYSYTPNETDSSESQNLLSTSIFPTQIDTLSPSSSPTSFAQLNDSQIIPRLTKCAKDMFRKPCVYMLNEGRCMRSDCRFAHDLHNITCKYWLEGECLKGESCEFLHDFPKPFSESLDQSNVCSFSSKKMQSIEIDTNKADGFNLDTSDFPELGAKSKSNKQQILTVVNDGKANNSQLDKIENLNSISIVNFKNANEDQSCEELNTVKSGSSLSKTSLTNYINCNRFLNIFIY